MSRKSTGGGAAVVVHRNVQRVGARLLVADPGFQAVRDGAQIVEREKQSPPPGEERPLRSDVDLHAEIRSGRVAANALIRAPRAAASAAGGPATSAADHDARYCDPAARARSAWAPRTAGESGGNSSSSSGRSCS